MKANIFLTIIAAAAMTSCSQNEVFDTMNTQNEINFRPTIGKQTTRAFEATKTTLEGDLNGFKVIGYATTDVFENITTGEAGTAFFNSTLKYANGIWGAENALYWPTNNGKLSIFAIYPTKIGDEGLNLISPKAVDGITSMAYPSLTVTIPALDKQVDLLLANTMNQNDKTQALAIQFKHVLSQVRFAARTTDGSYKVKIKEIKLVSTINNGTFTFNGKPEVGTWNATTPTRTNYDYFKKGAVMYPADNLFIGSSYDPIPSTGAKGALMLMPQSKNENFKLSVNYMISNPAGIMLAENVTKEVNMEALVMGKKYLYNLTLPVDQSAVIPITFTVDVTDWEADTNINVSYLVHKLTDGGTTDGKTLADNIAAFILNRTGEIAKHTVEVAGKMAVDIVIDLKDANDANLNTADEIVLDFSKVDFTAVVGTKITVKIAGNSNITANGGTADIEVKESNKDTKVVLKKKVVAP